MGVKYLFVAILFIVTNAVASSAESLRVVVISDLNGSYGSVTYNPRISVAIEQIISLEPDLVISTGDMVAGQKRPHLSETEVRSMWQAFHAVVSDPLARAGIPLAVTPGNHDASGYSGFEHERKIYAEEWRERRPDVPFLEGGDYPFHYAIEMNGVQFISLDATIIGRLDSVQKEFVRQLETRWTTTRIVFSHLPLWPFAHGRESQIIGDPDLELLFGTAGVDLHLSGHHHAFYPGVKDGIAYVSLACLGSGPRMLIGQDDRAPVGFTALEITDNGRIFVSAYEGARLDRKVDAKTLPEQIKWQQVVLDRLDIAPTDTVGWQQR